MSEGRRGVLRENVFLVAAVALPLVVVGFFLLSLLIPRWTVSPPSYDLLIRSADYYQTTSRVSIEYEIRNGKVVAIVTPLATNVWSAPRWKLFVFDHATMNVREIAVDVADSTDGLKAGDPPRTIEIRGLAGRQVLPEMTAPDGYRFENREPHGAGMFGELFGMNRYNTRASVVNKGRVISVVVPGENPYGYPIYALGWMAPESGAGPH